MAALERLEALVMSAAAFQSYLATVPRVAVILLEVLARRVRETTLNSLQFAMADTRGRVAARILDLAGRYGEATDAGLAIELPISQEELAAWAGASRAGTGQAMQTMRELGWIQTRRGQLVVQDLAALRARA